MSRTRLPLLAVAAVLAVLAGTLLLTGGGAPLPPAGGDPGLDAGSDPAVPDAGPGVAVLEPDDRAALGRDPVRRGADAPGADPDVVLTDPEAVVRAYLAAALTVSGADAGATHRRATPYAAPGSAPATVGVLVLDAPPPGQVRSARVGAVDLVAADRGDRRRGYRADVETRTGPPEGPVVIAAVTASVVVARQPDGRWLVAVDGPENPDLVAGED